MTKTAMVVGGNWTRGVEGRRSKYVTDLCDALDMLGYAVYEYNGGVFEALAGLLEVIERHPPTILIWMPNVSNDHDKLLPKIRQLMPRNHLLVQTKNNRQGKYNTAQLCERMYASGADLLLEFVMVGERITTNIIWQCGTVNQNVSDYGTANAINELLQLNSGLRPPISQNDLVVFDEPGISPRTFGFRRKYHTHEGYDVYCHDGSLVYPMTNGTIVNIRPFTGPAAGHPHWNDTMCVMVNHGHHIGVINYGEVMPLDGIKVGDYLQPGVPFAKVRQVLLKDKGRPMSMLHVERYQSGVIMPIPEWGVNDPRPSHLLDPTPLLACVYGW